MEGHRPVPEQAIEEAKLTTEVLKSNGHVTDAARRRSAATSPPTGPLASAVKDIRSGREATDIGGKLRGTFPSQAPER